MTVGLLDDSDDVLREASAALCVAGRPEVGDEELFAALRVQAALERAAQRAMVDTVAELQRRGAFAERGQRPATALADLLGLEPFEARRIVVAADHVIPRVDLQGQVLPARLPGTAAAFTAGAASLRHVQVVAGLMNGPTAEHLTPEVRAGAEEQIAAHAGEYTPTELRSWGAKLLELLDQDGALPDDREPAETNELFLTRNPNGSGGRIKGRIDNAAMFDVVAALIDAKAAPLTKDDTRSLGQRQAEAMAEIFGYVADHGDTDVLPATGGRRPHVNVLIRLEDLENRASAACLDFAGVATPAALRMLCCDACVIPVVLDGAGQPLDVGRMSRTIPDGLRRAVAARDRGCAHPGCDRPISWCEIHHIIPWEHGGETKLSNLVMLCRGHHRETHSSGWTVRIAPDGLPEFYPPSWICPEQRPRRKPVPIRPPGHRGDYDHLAHRLNTPKRNDTMPDTTDTRPPRTGADEKATLLGFLDYLRGAIAAKAEGVPDPQVRTAGVPSGTSLLGLVKHLACVERFYFLGEDVEDWEATLRPDPEETADGVLADYREAVRRANQVIGACTDLTRPAPRAPRRQSAPSMRWVLVHMIEETGRHAGHADILREQIDGAVGR